MWQINNSRRLVKETVGLNAIRQQARKVIHINPIEHTYVRRIEKVYVHAKPDLKIAPD